MTVLSRKRGQFKPNKRSRANNSLSSLKGEASGEKEEHSEKQKIPKPTTTNHSLNMGFQEAGAEDSQAEIMSKVKEDGAILVAEDSAQKTDKEEEVSEGMVEEEGVSEEITEEEEEALETEEVDLTGETEEEDLAEIEEDSVIEEVVSEEGEVALVEIEEGLEETEVEDLAIEEEEVTVEDLVIEEAEVALEEEEDEVEGLEGEILVTETEEAVEVLVEEISGMEAVADLEDNLTQLPLLHQSPTFWPKLKLKLNLPSTLLTCLLLKDFK